MEPCSKVTKNPRRDSQRTYGKSKYPSLKTKQNKNHSNKRLLRTFCCTCRSAPCAAVFGEASCCCGWKPKPRQTVCREGPWSTQPFTGRLNQTPPLRAHRTGWKSSQKSCKSQRGMEDTRKTRPSKQTRPTTYELTEAEQRAQCPH